MKEIIDFDFGDKTSHNKQLKSNNFNLVLNVIAQYIIRNKPNKNGYVTIPSFVFKNVYTGYHSYLVYLITSGYVERDYYDVKKHKAYSYRFSNMYKDQLEIRKIRLSYGQAKKKNKYDLANKPIDLPDDINERLIADFKGCQLDYNLKKEQLAKTKDEWGNFIDISKWINNNIKMQKWVNGELSFCWKSNRLYTNFTGLSGAIRLNNVRLNNESLVEFDIHNSFPLMLAKYCINENSNIVMDYDFKCFCDSIMKGKFYTQLQYKLNSVRNCETKGIEGEYDNRLLTKTETKLLFQIYLNGKNKENRHLNGLKVLLPQIMKYHYGVVDDIVNKVKANKEQMYFKLVEIETKFMLDVIADLYQQFPDIKILTCHDAIYVPKSFESRVKEIWDVHFKVFTDGIPFDDNDDDDDNIDYSYFGIIDLDDDEEL